MKEDALFSPGCYLVLFALFICCRVYADVPSNREVEREVERITSKPGYRWLKEGGEKQSVPASSPVHGKGAVEDETPVKYDRGCTPEASFGDDFESTDEQDNGCGAGADGMEGCAVNFNSCSCGETPGSCGNGTATGAYLKVAGFAVGIIAFTLLLLAVAWAVSRKEKPDSVKTDVPSESSEVRVSSIASMDSSAFMERAKEAAKAGDYREAVGLAYLAGISTVARKGFVKLEKHTTNGVIIDSTRKKGGPHQAVDVLARHFEDLFFGEREATEPRWLECQEAVEGGLNSYVKQQEEE